MYERTRLTTKTELFQTVLVKIRSYWMHAKTVSKKLSDPWNQAVACSVCVMFPKDVYGSYTQPSPRDPALPPPGKAGFFALAACRDCDRKKREGGGDQSDPSASTG